MKFSDELNVLQVSFNKALRLFMKSPTGDASKMVEQYDRMRQMKLSFSPKLRERAVTIPEVFNYERLKGKDFAYRIIQLMRDETVPVQNFIHSFIIHGSYATQDFISDWSDLDTMVILKDRVFDSAVNLMKVKRVFLKLGLLCYWVDPLAHHQLSFITEFDLNYYPQSFLPLPSYENGMLLSGVQQLRFSLRDDAFERAANVEKFRAWFRRKVSHLNWSRNQYDWKNDLAHVFMLPSLILQASDIYVYKKVSFAKIKELFDDFDDRPIEEATRIMKNWKVPNWVRYLPPRLIMRLPYLLSRVIVFIARKPSLQMRPVKDPAEIEKLTREFLSFYEYEKRL